MQNVFLKLVGKTINKIFLSKDSYYLGVELNSGEKLAWQAVGDCCARAYFYSVEGFEDIVGQEILNVEISQLHGQDLNRYEVLDCDFITFKSAKGRGLIEFRTEHNGYYGGCAEPCGFDLLGDNPSILFNISSISNVTETAINN